MYIHIHINFQIAGTNGQYQVPEYTIRGECTTMDLGAAGGGEPVVCFLPWSSSWYVGHKFVLASSRLLVLLPHLSCTHSIKKCV